MSPRPGPLAIGLCALALLRGGPSASCPSPPGEAPAAALSADLAAFSGPVAFERIVVEPFELVQGHKPKDFGDFDSDGDLDVLALTRGQGMYWYEYPGFQKHPIHPGGGGEDALAADLDGDGDVDVVVSGTADDSDEDPVWFENPLSGAGRADALWTMHALGHAGYEGGHDLLVGDVDGDGRLDVVALNGIFFQDAPDAWSFVRNPVIVPERGDSWDAPSQDAQRKGSELGDVDGDGDLDLVTIDKAAPFTVLWFANPESEGLDARSSVWPVREIGPGWFKTSLRLVDLDDDGNPDVLAAPAAGPGGLRWFRAPPDPTASGAAWQDSMIDDTIYAVHQGSMHAADVDLDGTIDVLLTEQEQSPLDRVAVYYNLGGGAAWQPHWLAQTGGHNCKAGDLDGDGDVDLLSANHGWYGSPNPIEIWRNTLLSPPRPLAVDDAYAVARNGVLAIDESRGVLANDVGFSGAPLAAQLSFPGPGVPSLLPGGAFSYTPPPAFTGTATFRYRADDAAASSYDGVVRLRVTPPPGPDLLGYWPFDEGAGPAAWDGSGHGRPGEIGAALWSGETADASAGSLFLDGSDDAVTFAAPLAASGTALSVTAWVRPWLITGLTKDGRIVSKATGTGVSSYDLLLATGLVAGQVRLVFRIRTSAGVATLNATSGELLPGVWHHAAAVYDGAALRLYLDGQPVGTANASGPFVFGAGVPLAIGNQPPGAGALPWSGHLDDVRIYGRALGASEVQQLAQWGALPACSNLLDDDGDGAVDHPADAQCASPTGVREKKSPACGLGFEASLLAAALAARLRRGRT